jgi:hypothetical protein
LILLAGDCTGSAYLFAPRSPSSTATSQHHHNNNNKSQQDIPSYELAFEIECGATVRLNNNNHNN